MAQVEWNNETGQFDSVVGDEVVTDSDYVEIQEVLEEQEAAVAADELPEESEVLENAEDSGNILDDLGTTTLPDPEETLESPEITFDDYAIDPYASIPSSYSFTPVAWQVNLAQSRSMGQHYLMYADRIYSGSSSYWRYYLVLGTDISYNADLYTYDDCDVYSYYSYNSTVYYDRNLGSGTIDGDHLLVYSDLYFDYVGVDPVNNSMPYLLIVLLLIICVLIIIGGRRHV